MFIFQITIRKDKRHYLSLNTLQSFVPELIDFSNNHFNLQIKAENITFYYILSKEYNDKELVFHCEQYGLLYLHFSFKDLAFTNKSLKPKSICHLAENKALPYQNFYRCNIASQVSEFLQRKTCRKNDSIKDMLHIHILPEDEDINFVMIAVRKLLKADEIELSMYKYFNVEEDFSITHEYALIILYTKSEKRYFLQKKKELFKLSSKSGNFKLITQIPTMINDLPSLGLSFSKITIINKQA